MKKPLHIATRGFLNSPLSIATRGYLSIEDDKVQRVEEKKKNVVIGLSELRKESVIDTEEDKLIIILNNFLYENN